MSETTLVKVKMAYPEGHQMANANGQIVEMSLENANYIVSKAVAVIVNDDGETHERSEVLEIHEDKASESIEETTSDLIQDAENSIEEGAKEVSDLVEDAINISEVSEETTSAPEPKAIISKKGNTKK